MSESCEGFPHAAASLYDLQQVFSRACLRWDQIPASVNLGENRHVLIGKRVFCEVMVVAVFLILLNQTNRPLRANIAQRLDNDSLFELTAIGEMLLQNADGALLLAGHHQGVHHRKNKFLAVEPRVQVSWLRIHIAAVECRVENRREQVVEFLPFGIVAMEYDKGRARQHYIQISSMPVLNNGGDLLGANALWRSNLHGAEEPRSEGFVIGPACGAGEQQQNHADDGPIHCFSGSELFKMMLPTRCSGTFPSSSGGEICWPD